MSYIKTSICARYNWQSNRHSQSLLVALTCLTTIFTSWEELCLARLPS